MARILIICDVYPPSFAPRMGYLVKYIKELGWSADIITGNHDGDVSFKSLLGKEKVIRVKRESVIVKNTIDVFRRILTQKIQHKKNVSLISDRIIKDLNPNDYKLILCSTAHRTFVLESAYNVAKAWNKPWIADLRDIYEQLPKSMRSNGIKNNIITKFKYNYMLFMLRRRNTVLKNANAVITITPWHINQLRKYNKNVNLIYNGFDPDYYFPREQTTRKCFTIIYTGSVHKNIQDPEFLFLATKKLKNNNLINATLYRIEFYVPSNWRKNIINSNTYPDIKEFVHFFDYVDTTEVPDLLNKSSILLLLSNLQQLDGPKGLLSTTKYFEYLAVERPILCVRSDEALLEASIKESNAGVSARTVEEAYDFILNKWNEWKEKKHTTVKINRDYTKQFSRKLQAKQFVQLFEKTIES